MMRVTAGLWMGIVLSLTSLQAHAHPVESRVAIEPEQEAAFTAGKIHFEFQLVDTKTNQILTSQDLMVMHEKLLHLYFYDPSLSQFRHVHPEFNGHVWTVDTDLSVNGNYWVWAQGQLGSDSYEFLGSNRLIVQGGQSEIAPPSQLGDIRHGTDGNSAIALDAGVLHAKANVMLTATVSHGDGSAPVLTDYLGARAHITIVSGDADALIHVHPMNMGDSNRFMIHASFPEAGDYRIWIQFLDGGALKTIPLSVTVVE